MRFVPQNITKEYLSSLGTQRLSTCGHGRKGLKIQLRKKFDVLFFRESSAKTQNVMLNESFRENPSANA